MQNRCRMTCACVLLLAVSAWGREPVFSRTPPSCTVGEAQDAGTPGLAEASANAPRAPTGQAPTAVPKPRSLEQAAAGTALLWAAHHFRRRRQDRARR